MEYREENEIHGHKNTMCENHQIFWMIMMVISAMWSNWNQYSEIFIESDIGRKGKTAYGHISSEL